MSETAPGDTVEIELAGPSGRGASAGRLADGRVVFVDGGLPGETVVARLEEVRRRWARGTVVEVVRRSAGRQTPTCATGRAGCGGCDLAHAHLALQHEMKTTVVTDALQRLGRIAELPDLTIRTTTESRYRTTVRAAVVDGRAGYRRRGSHEVIVADECLVAHPLVEQLLREGRWGEANEVVIRVSAATGERLAVVHGDASNVRVPGDVAIATPGDPDPPSVTEVAGGRNWRVSAESFFQAGPDAATALVDAVAAASSGTGGRLVDAYCGIGLFSGTVGGGFDDIVAIERSSSSVADARVNLDGRVTIEAKSGEDWRVRPADVVIADPARAGLGRRAVEVLASTGASRFVLVSCDPGSMGRDAGLLADAGYRIDRVEVVDAFPDTSHVETVLGWSR